MIPFLLDFNPNSPAVKYAILVLATPLWLPFVKALWKEFNDILAEEGGLLGKEPEGKELKQIQREKLQREASLVRELRDADSFAAKLKPELGRKAGFSARGPRSGGQPTAQRRRGFGPPR